jgi:hypothetical protein
LSTEKINIAFKGGTPKTTFAYPSSSLKFDDDPAADEHAAVGHGDGANATHGVGKDGQLWNEGVYV